MTRARRALALASVALLGLLVASVTPAAGATVHARTLPTVRTVRTVNLGFESAPTAVVVDRSRHLAYSAGLGADAVLVTDLTTGRTVGVPLVGGNYPSDATDDLFVDTTRHELIVLTDQDITLMRGTSVVATRPLPAGTFDISGSFDQQNGLLYLLVNDAAGDQLLVVKGTVTVATYTQGDPRNDSDGPPVVDTGSGLVYAPLKGAGVIDVLSGSSVVQQIPTDQYPYRVVVDDAHSLVYGLSLDGVLDVVKDGTVVDRFVLGHGGAYYLPALWLDRGTGDLYVADDSGVQVFRDGHERGEFGRRISRAVLDPTRDLLYAETGDGVEVLHGTHIVATCACAPDHPGNPAQDIGVYDAHDDLTFVALAHSVVAFRGARLVARRRTGLLPAGVALDRSRHDLAVVSLQDGTLSELHVTGG